MLNFKSTSLRKRILSALILGPLALWLIWAGGVIFDFMLIVAAALALYEGVTLSRQVQAKILTFVFLSIYILISAYCFYMIRTVYGPYLMFLLIFMVWFSDIDAYFTGKIIGGPKMAEKISPNKTWAGLMGAMFSPAVLAGLFYWYQAGGYDLFLWRAVGAGLFIGLTAQGGDLIMSFVKRKAGVKDTSNLIPGHGGILDRIDGLLLATPVFFLMVVYMPHVFGG